MLVVIHFFTLYKPGKAVNLVKESPLNDKIALLWSGFEIFVWSGDEVKNHLDLEVVFECLRLVWTGPPFGFVLGG